MADCKKWGKSIKLNDYDVDVGEPRGNGLNENHFVENCKKLLPAGSK